MRWLLESGSLNCLFFPERLATRDFSRAPTDRHRARRLRRFEAASFALARSALYIIHLAYVAGFEICPSNVRVQPRHELVAIAPVRSDRRRPLLCLEMVAEGFDGCFARAGHAL